MTDIEFREQYKRLREVHPHYFTSEEKFNTTWEYVKDLDVAWFRSLVDKMVIATTLAHKDNRYDIAEAAAAERRHRKSKKFADDVCEASKTWTRVNENGLDNVLKKYKANSLLDAVMKSRKGDVGA